MAPYVVPQVLVHQEFTTLPTTVVSSLRGFVFGPNYNLHRYSDEKTTIDLGDYNPSADTAYSWPNRSAGEVVDYSYTKLYMDDAWGRFMHETTGANCKRVTGYYNKFRWDSKYVVDVPSYPLDASFHGRSLQLGDGVYVDDPVTGKTDKSYITGFEYEQVAATVDTTPDADSGNMGAHSSAATVTPPLGITDPVLTCTHADYRGYEVGVYTDTYTLTCLQAPTGGDLRTAVFSLVSASGLDDDPSLSFTNDYGVASEIGAHGLTLTFTKTLDDVLLGQVWTVAVTAAYTVPVPTGAGTYTGTWFTTYIVRCISGGDAGTSTKPVFTITTNTGVDIAGPVEFDGTAMSVGNYGVTIDWATDVVAKNDMWFIDVTPAGNGGIKTIVLANNIDPTVGTNAVNIDLFIRKNIVLTQNRTGHAPQQNFTQSATQITVKTGAIFTDSTWQSGTVELPVYYADMYSEYRGLNLDYSHDVHSLSNAAEVEAVLGPISLDNPLAYGVYTALENSGSVEVKFTAVASDDLTGYSTVIDMISDREDVYSLVPLTTDDTILSLVEAHVLSSSTPEIGRWRIAWLSTVQPLTIGRITVNEDEEAYLCDVSDDPAAVGTQYTYVKVYDVNLLESTLIAGDDFRFNYTNDGFGNWTYDTYKIDAILSEDTLRLVTGPASPTAVPMKFEIWHNTTKQEEAAAYAAKATSFGSRRVRLIHAPEGAFSGVDIPDMYVACAMAGLRSSAQPQQPLTNVEFIGLDYVNMAYFSTAQLNLMAGSGVWLIAQEPLTSESEPGRVYIRHQLTTDNTDLNRQEDSVTTNVDAISFLFRDEFRPYIGRVNITDATLSDIRFLCSQIISYAKTIGISTAVGPMLIDATIDDLRVHATLKDRIVAVISLTVPYPLNGLEIYLVV